MKLSWHESIWRARFSGQATPQALLLTAMKGTGEVEFALRVAAARLCAVGSPTGDACGSCDDCRWFAADAHPDFRRLDPMHARAEVEEDTEGREGETDSKKKKASTVISVDEVREVIEFLHVAAHRNGARVVLIHPAHSLNPAAANALLKILEEPPAGASFILVTAQPSRLPATIRSRCVTLPLPRPSAPEAAQWLQSAGMKDPGLALAQVGGAPMAALELGERYWAVRDALLPALAGIDPDWIEASGRMGEGDLVHLVHLLQTWCWDMTSTRIGGDVRYHPDQAKPIAAAAARVAALPLADFSRKLSAARRLLGHPLNAKLFAEDLLMTYARLAPAP